MSRTTLLAQTLVQLVDTLADDFDVVDLLTLLTARCVEVLEVSAAGLMLAAPEDLRVVAHQGIRQLNEAINDGVTIERAGGVLAERVGVSVEQNFSRLLRHARDNNRHLVEVCPVSYQWDHRISGTATSGPSTRDFQMSGGVATGQIRCLPSRQAMASHVPDR